MEKVTVKAKQTLQGEYGLKKAGESIEINEKDARKLAEAGLVEMKGVKATAEGKAPVSEGTRITTHEPAPDSNKTVNRDATAPENRTAKVPVKSTVKKSK